MKKKLLTFILSLTLIGSYGQSVDGKFTSMGGTINSNGITVNYSGGSSIIIGETNGILFNTSIVPNTVSVDEINSIDLISFYPNPANDFININSTVELVQIYNLTGQLIIQEQNIQRIDISNITPGVYVMLVKSKSKLSKLKLIKK